MRKRIIVYFTACLCFISILSSGIINTSAATSKYKVGYPAAVRMDVDDSGAVVLSGYLDFENLVSFKITKIATSSKNLKARIDKRGTSYAHEQSVTIYGKKEGTYTLNVAVKIKKTGKKETIKIPVYIGDTTPIAEIKIGGTKLDAFEKNGSSFSSSSYPTFSYFSKKTKGKMEVNMKKNYIIKRIEIQGTDRDRQNKDSYKSPYYNRGSHETQIKNGENVTLNNRADGKTTQTYINSDSNPQGGYWSPVYSTKETFSFRTAMTCITIYYYEKHSDEELRIDIVVYTKAKTS